MEIDQHLRIIHALRDRLDAELPGEDAQNLLSPVIAHDKYRIAPVNHKVACVMAVLYPVGAELHMAYIERTSHHPDDKHAGQISLPGGKLESYDESYLAGALREVEEEIGIPREDIKVLGALTELYVFASNFLVYPFVGYLDQKPTFKAQESEVASIISFPIMRLLADDIVKIKDLNVRNTIIKEVPYYELDQHILWGATAMITSELVALFKSVY